MCISLQAISTRVNALKHVVSIHNVPSGSKVEDVEATIRSALEKQGIELHPEHEINAKQLFKSNRSTVTLRYDRQSGASKRELLAALNEVCIDFKILLLKLLIVTYYIII